MVTTPVARCDFETFSAAGYVYDLDAEKWRSPPGCGPQKRGIGATGVYPYVEHWSYRPLMIDFELPDGRGGQWEWGEPFDVLAPLFDWVRAGGLVEGHNVEFERVNWNHYCVPVLGWPHLSIRQTRCSAAKSRAWGLANALEDTAAILQTPTQKDKDGDRLMKIFSNPHNPTKKDRSLVTLPSAKPIEWLRYKSYNHTDVVTQREVSTRVPDLTPTEQENWYLDQEINERGVAVDSKAIADCIAIFEQCAAKYGAEFTELTGGIKHSELQQFRGWLGASGVHLPNMQEETLEIALASLTHVDALDPLYPAKRALEIRALVGSASVKKLYALDIYKCHDARVRGLYMFHSTHHGRTGGYGPQPSNLYSGEWHEPHEVEAALAVLASRDLATVEAAYPNIGPLDVINNCLRSLFIAAPDHVLVSSDYSAIEDVVLAALAGEEWVLDVHRTHGMIYEAQIAMMTGIPFEEFVKHRTDTGGIATYDDAGRLVGIKGGKHHPLRKQGKLAKLSGGYASWVVGWKKFGADEYYDNDAEIKRAILKYRDSVPNTVEFWGGQTRDKFRSTCRQELYGLEGAAIRAVLEPGQCFRVGLIAFQVVNDVLYMQLPSGRLIAYQEPRLTPATRKYAEDWELALSYMGWENNPGVWCRMDLYGGVLTQNAVGGTARDIMMHGMQNVTRLGYPIVLHTYDEAVSEVPIGFGSLAEFEAGLNDMPEWARGWPIFARGGFVQKHYGKWETQ